MGYYDMEIDEHKEARKKINKEVGLRVNKLRTEKDLSCNELAKRANLTAQTIRRIEIGEKGLSTISARNICAALGISADYLINGVDVSDDLAGAMSQMLAGLTEEECRAAEKMLSALVEIFKYRFEK